jgi:hypothetical protein
MRLWISTAVGRRRLPSRELVAKRRPASSSSSGSRMSSPPSRRDCLRRWSAASARLARVGRTASEARSSRRASVVCRQRRSLSSTASGALRRRRSIISGEALIGSYQLSLSCARMARNAALKGSCACRAVSSNTCPRHCSVSRIRGTVSLIGIEHTLPCTLQPRISPAASAGSRETGTRGRQVADAVPRVPGSAVRVVSTTPASRIRLYYI